MGEMSASSMWPSSMPVSRSVCHGLSSFACASLLASSASGKQLGQRSVTRDGRTGNSSSLTKRWMNASTVIEGLTLIEKIRVHWSSTVLCFNQMVKSSPGCGSVSVVSALQATGCGRAGAAVPHLRGLAGHGGSAARAGARDASGTLSGERLCHASAGGGATRGAAPEVGGLQARERTRGAAREGSAWRARRGQLSQLKEGWASLRDNAAPLAQRRQRAHAAAPR